MYPNMPNQFYLQDLQSQRDRIDKQIQQAKSFQYPQTPQINQTFQLSPTQNNGAIKYVESIEDVKKELVFGDTIFLQKELTQMWLKNLAGDIKTYDLTEVVELDPKDEEIALLKAKIEQLESERNNEPTNVNEPTNASTTKKRPTNVSKSK